MTRPTVLLRRALMLAFGATLLLAGPAAAHPFIQGGEAPVDSHASVVLDLAHGCSADEGDGHGEGEAPTTEVALEVPDWVRILEVPEVDGYAVDLETNEDGRVEVVTWTATDGGVPVPELPFEAVFSGDPGGEVHLGVFQACDDLSYRWVGTPDEPAEYPAVRLTLADPDPDSPAPEPEPGPDDDAEAAVTDEDAPGDAPPEEDAEQPADEPADEDATEGEEAEAISAPTETDDSPVLWIVVALVGVALLVAVVLGLRRRPVADPAPAGAVIVEPEEGDDASDTGGPDDVDGRP